MKTSINSNVVHEGNCRPIKQGLVSLPGELKHEEHSLPLLPLANLPLKFKRLRGEGKNFGKTA